MRYLLFDKAHELPNTMQFLFSVKSVSITIYTMLNDFVCDMWCHENRINYLIKSWLQVFQFNFLYHYILWISHYQYYYILLIYVVK